MKQNIVTNSSEPALVVILHIRKQEHADFLRDLFNGQRGKPIKLNLNEPIGRFIFSLRRYSLKPVKQTIPAGMFALEAEFPITDYSTHEKHFCFFPLEHVEQINYFVSACFDLYFHTYFFDTSDLDHPDSAHEFEQVQITRQMLVESFVMGLDMLDFSRASETVKKREYRQAVKEMVRKQKKFLQKDYNFRKKIYLKRKSNLKSILFQHDTNKQK